MAEATKEAPDKLDEHNAILIDRILVKRLLKAEALFPEWLRRNSPILASAMDKEQVLAHIGKENWDAFLKFMQGQTIGARDDKPVFYRHDVESFASNLDKKKVQ